MAKTALNNIDLTVSERKTISSMLKRYVPNTQVWAYGSRVTFKARPTSDLDMVVFADEHQSTAVGNLRETLEESDFPFRVDLFVWDKVPERFKPNIEEAYFVLQEKQQECLPSGWVECRLRNVVKFGNGKSRPKTEGNIPVYGGNGVLQYSDKYNYSGEIIIIGRVGAYCGSIYYENRNIWISDNALAAKPKEKNSPKFLYYLLKDMNLNFYAQGSSHPLLNQTILNNLEVKIPSLPEQKAIAAVLGALDDKIELNRQMNETLEEMARAIFKSWFVDFDPVHAKAALHNQSPIEQRDGKSRAKVAGEPVESDWTVERAKRYLAHMDTETAALFPSAFYDNGLPMGWTNKPLDEVADFLNGAAMQKFPAEGNDFLPVIKIAELRNGISSNTNHASPDVPEKYVIFDGDVLFAWSGSLMQKVWTEGKGALNQHLFKVTSENYEKWFFYYWIDYHMQWFQSIAASKATTMGHIQRKHLAEAKVVVPHQTVMQSSSKVIGPLLEKQTLNSIENQTLAELRDTLLPKLMSGEIRVKGVEQLEI